ncbi:hypothetical protein [Aquimarina sp. 433]
MISKKLIVILLVPLLSFSKSDSLLLKKRIDSLSYLLYDYCHRDYLQYCDILENAKEIDYHEGVLRSHIGLIGYFSFYKNLDSVFYHSKEYEKYEQIYSNKKIKFQYHNEMAMSMTYFFYQPSIGFNHIIEAYAIADSDKKRADISLMLMDNFSLKNQYAKAVELGESLIEKGLFNKQTNPKAFNDLESALHYGYQGLGNVEKSVSLIASLEKYYFENEQKDNLSKHILAYIKLYKSYNYYLQHQYQKAIDSLNANYDFVSTNWDAGLSIHHEFLALSYAGLKDFYQAKKAIKRSFKQAEFNRLPELYYKTASYYKELNKKDSVIYYFELRDQLIDSIRDEEEKLFIDYFQTKKENIDITLDNKAISEEKELLTKQNYDKTKSLLVLVLFLVLLIFIFVWLIKQYKVVRKKVVFVSKEKNQLHTKIAIKDHKITTTLVRQEQQLDHLKNIRNEMGLYLESDKSKIFKKNLSMLEKFITKGIGKDDVIDELIYQNQELVVALKQKVSKLSKTDLVHCILVYREINIKDSADLLHINNNTVRTARYRAKSKLGLSKEHSMSQFLDQLVKGGEVSL